MRTGRGPTVAGTATQYQPPFHRIIYLAAGDSTPTTSWLDRSAAFVRARPRSALPAAFARIARRRALTSVRREPSVGSYRFAASFEFPSLRVVPPARFPA